VTRTVTVSGKVMIAKPAVASSEPPTAGLAAMVLTMQVLAPGDPELGIGSGGPKVHPGMVQLRLLPVWLDVAGASTIAVAALQSLMP